MIFKFLLRNEPPGAPAFIILTACALSLPEKHFKTMLLFMLSFILLLWTSCAPVRGYQKMYVADDEMILKERMIETFEIEAESYREGASGGSGGKTGGGCGCN